MTIQPLSPLEHNNDSDSLIHTASYTILADDGRISLGGVSVLSGVIYDNSIDAVHNAFHNHDKAAAHSLLCVSETEGSELYHASTSGGPHLFLFIYELFTIIDSPELIQRITEAVTARLRELAYASGAKSADIAFFAEESNEFGFGTRDERWIAALKNVGFQEASREANVLFCPAHF